MCTYVFGTAESGSEGEKEDTWWNLFRRVNMETGHAYCEKMHSLHRHRACIFRKDAFSLVPIVRVHCIRVILCCFIVKFTSKIFLLTDLCVLRTAFYTVKHTDLYAGTGTGTYVLYACF